MQICNDACNHKSIQVCKYKGMFVCNYSSIILWKNLQQKNVLSISSQLASYYSTFIKNARCTNEESFLKKILNFRQNLKTIRIELGHTRFPSNSFTFDLVTGLQSKSIQWVNNFTWIKSQSPKKYLVQGNFLSNYLLQK